MQNQTIIHGSLLILLCDIFSSFLLIIYFVIIIENGKNFNTSIHCDTRVYHIVHRLLSSIEFLLRRKEKKSHSATKSIMQCLVSWWKFLQFRLHFQNLSLPILVHQEMLGTNGHHTIVDTNT